MMAQRKREFSAVRILSQRGPPEHGGEDEGRVDHEGGDQLQQAAQRGVLLQRVVRVGQQPVRLVRQTVVRRVDAPHPQRLERAAVPHRPHRDQEKQEEN
jgi:hypothetical protein